MATLLAGCQLTPPPVDPTLATKRAEADRAALQAKSDATAADAKVTELRAQELEMQAESTRQDQIAQAHAQRVADAEAATKTHQNALERARALGETCRKGTTPSDNEAVDLHEYLVKFQSDPTRDKAIADLDSCRKLIRKREQATFRALIQEARAQLAVDIEDGFDESNPIYRGRLKARVKGTELRVSMRGNFQGRRRHSQSEVDSWCNSDTGFVFSKIVLKNSHGTFSCKPDFSAKEAEEASLEKMGIATAWTPPPSGDTYPPSPVSPSPDNQAPDNPELANVQASLESARSAYFQANQRAQEAAHARQAIETEHDVELRAWRAVKISGSKKMQTAGIVVGGLGLAGAVVGGVGSASRRETTTELESARAEASAFEGVPGVEPDLERIADLEAKEQRQRTTAIVGYGVGVPLLLTGVILYFVGRNRQSKLRAMAVSADGLRLRF